MKKNINELNKLELKYAAAAANGWTDLEKSGGFLRMEVLVGKSTQVEYFLDIECDSVEAAMQYAEEMKCFTMWRNTYWVVYPCVPYTEARGDTLAEALVKLYCISKLGQVIEIPQLLIEHEKEVKEKENG